MNVRRWCALVVLAFLGTQAGCVKKSTYNRALGQLADSRAEYEALDGAMADARANFEERERALAQQLDVVRADLNQTRGDLREAERDLARARSQLAVESGNRRRLEILLDERGQEADQLRVRINALSAVENEIRQRNRIYEDVIARFQSLIDAGQLSVSIVRGRMVINLPQDVLFQSGSASLSRDGTDTVTRVGEVLAQIPDRRFQVEGHTDNVPIATARFPSNWELSSGRALAVVHLLRAQGVAPDDLSGAGYGEHQPVAANETPEGRRANRRIEIVMLPNLDVISSVTPAP